MTHISYAKHEIDSVGKGKHGTNRERKTFHFAVNRLEHMIAFIIQFETFREKISLQPADDIVGASVEVKLLNVAQTQR